MTTFNETMHPRERTGQFATKTNSAPVGTLTEPATEEKPGGHSIKLADAHARGLREVSAGDYANREVVTAHELQRGDVIMWESIDDGAGVQYWEEEITYHQVLIDMSYKRHVRIETPKNKRGIQLSYRSVAARRPAPEAEAQVAYPPTLRGGLTPDDLAVKVDSSDQYGSTLTLHEAGQAYPPMLDRFRVTERLEPGTEIALLEASRDVQERVADRFVPLDGLSYDEVLKREPLHHEGRAWND